MTYITVGQSHTDDERWIEAGADAFAVHIAALVYCDRQLTDGRISTAMAQRVSLAVPQAEPRPRSPRCSSSDSGPSTATTT
jgi:hypothetical protein